MTNPEGLSVVDERLEQDLVTCLAKLKQLKVEILNEIVSDKSSPRILGSILRLYSLVQLRKHR